MYILMKKTKIGPQHEQIFKNMFNWCLKIISDWILIDEKEKEFFC